MTQRRNQRRMDKLFLFVAACHLSIKSRKDTEDAKRIRLPLSRAIINKHRIFVVLFEGNRVCTSSSKTLNRTQEGVKSKQ